MNGSVMVRQLGWILLAVSGSLVLGALWFQHVAGLAPCEMCLWQRYAHLGVMALALLTAVSGSRTLLGLAVLAMLVSAGLAGFHAGVEQQWWPGPVGCSGGLPANGAASDMFDQMLGQPLVRCDAIPWSFLGLSMAGWNGIVSATAALVALLMMRRTMA